jgi:hypothetical protein
MLKTKQQGRRNQRPGHSLCTLRRASRRLCDDPRGRREDTAELFRDDLVRLCAEHRQKGRPTDEQIQKIPVHGTEHSEARAGPQRQDSRHSEDARDCAVFEVKRCAALSYLPCMRSN